MTGATFARLRLREMLQASAAELPPTEPHGALLARAADCLVAIQQKLTPAEHATACELIERLVQARCLAVAFECKRIAAEVISAGGAP
jgi:hypothetical protein